MKSTEGTGGPRKRTRTIEDGDDAALAAVGKKTRGRPRVDTQDATAADRRRTQIRLAQRAYRQRKETTISSLKQQSSRLRTIIEEMNKAFLRYNDSIVQAGLLHLNPGLARDVKQVTETFAKCVKSSHERTMDSDEEELGGEVLTQELQKDVVATSTTQDQSPTATHKSTESWRYGATSHAPEQPRAQAVVTQPESYLSHISSSSYSLPESNDLSSLVRRYQFNANADVEQARLGRLANQASTSTDRARTQEQQQSQQSLPFGLVDVASRDQSPFLPPYIFPVHVPAMGADLPPVPRHLLEKSSIYSAPPTINKALSPGIVRSSEESSFSRRLWRSTIEAGYLLLCTPNVHPGLLEYAFRLTLPYLSLDEIRNRFKIILSRGLTEDLDWYDTPFLHLGGAGTHYQRRDAQGRPIPLKNAWTIHQIGPPDRRMLRIENVSDGQAQKLEGVDLVGFEGEWFDSYDVQGYLEEKWHCKIDAKSSFAECLIDDDTVSLPNETESPSLSRGSTAGNSETAVSPVPVSQAFNAFEPAYGLDMPFDSPPLPSFMLTTAKQSPLDLSFDQTLGLDLAPGFDMGFVGGTGYNMLGLHSLNDTELPPIPKQKPKRAALVDVQKLIDRIILRGVCLGRAPGYRRKDIDVALKEALLST